MGETFNKKITIDKHGQIISERIWTNYDGFSDKGYKYRGKQNYIRYYPDALPNNLDHEALLLLFMVAEIMNEENMLVYRVTKKSKFSKILYKGYTQDDIRARLRFPYGQNKFNRAWAQLKKHCVKKIRYYDTLAWAVNPSVISRCHFLPDFLYLEFKDYLNPFLSPHAISEFQRRTEGIND